MRLSARARGYLVVSAGMPQIVLDTNVWLDLLLFRDPGCATLEAALESGAVRAVTREDCREEWRRVLHYPQLPIDDMLRPALEQAFDHYVIDASDEALAPEASAALPRCADPDDQKFLELAQASRARWLLSKDKALLVLHRRALERAGFAIMRPSDWLTPAGGGQW